MSCSGTAAHSSKRQVTRSGLIIHSKSKDLLYLVGSYHKSEVPRNISQSVYVRWRTVRCHDFVKELKVTGPATLLAVRSLCSEAGRRCSVQIWIISRLSWGHSWIIFVVIYLRNIARTIAFILFNKFEVCSTVCQELGSSRCTLLLQFRRKLLLVLEQELGLGHLQKKERRRERKKKKERKKSPRGDHALGKMCLQLQMPPTHGP